MPCPLCARHPSQPLTTWNCCCDCEGCLVVTPAPGSAPAEEDTTPTHFQSLANRQRVDDDHANAGATGSQPSVATQDEQFQRCMCVASGVRCLRLQTDNPSDGRFAACSTAFRRCRSRCQGCLRNSDPPGGSHQTTEMTPVPTVTLQHADGTSACIVPYRVRDHRGVWRTAREYMHPSSRYARPPVIRRCSEHAVDWQPQIQGVACEYRNFRLHILQLPDHVLQWLDEDPDLEPCRALQREREADPRTPCVT